MTVEWKYVKFSTQQIKSIFKTCFYLCIKKCNVILYQKSVIKKKNRKSSDADGNAIIIFYINHIQFIF